MAATEPSEAEMKEMLQVLSIQAKLSSLESQKVRGSAAFYDAMPSSGAGKGSNIEDSKEELAQLDAVFTASVTAHRNRTYDKAQLDSRNYSLTEELPALKSKLALLQAQCREAQLSAKLSQTEQAAKLASHEERRKKLHEETNGTMVSILAKVEAEETGLTAKLSENHDLQQRLLNVIDMVEKQKQHEEAVGRAVSLHTQLENAKEAQKESVAQSMQDEETARQTQLAEQRAKNQELVEMNSMYLEKTEMFSNTINSNRTYQTLLAEKKGLLEQRHVLLTKERDMQAAELRKLEAKVINAALLPNELTTLASENQAKAAQCKLLQMQLKALKASTAASANAGAT
jgi:hypothetical protein